MPSLYHAGANGCAVGDAQVEAAAGPGGGGEHGREEGHRRVPSHTAGSRHEQRDKQTAELLQEEECKIELERRAARTQEERDGAKAARALIEEDKRAEEVCSSQPTCSICMDVIDLAIALPCRHEFHSRCLAEWAMTKSRDRRKVTCPVCRQKFEAPNGRWQPVPHQVGGRRWIWI